MYWIGRVFGGSIRFIVNEVVFRHHFDVRVFDVDRYRTAKSNSDRSISGEQSPPNTFPESLIGFAELRRLDAITMSV